MAVVRIDQAGVVNDTEMGALHRLGSLWPDVGPLLALLWVDRPAWVAEAACRGEDPALFFPERGASLDPAKAMCARCPVRDACLADALEHHTGDGIWGGLSGKGRKRLAHGRAA